MSIIASSDFTSIAWGFEEVEGTVHPTVPLREIYITGESLRFDKETIQSRNLSSHRQVIDYIPAGFQSAGSLEIELSTRMYDPFMAAALWNNWTTPVDVTGTASMVAATRTLTMPGVGTDAEDGQFIRLENMTEAENNGAFQVESHTDNTLTFRADPDSAFKDETDTVGVRACGSMLRNGQARRPIYIERKQSDTVPVQFMGFNGLFVNSLSISAQARQILTGSINLMGRRTIIHNDGAHDPITNPNGGQGTLSAGDAWDPALPYRGMSASVNIGNIRLDGRNVNAKGGAVAGNILFQGFSFNIANSLRGVAAIGVEGNATVNPSKTVTEGELSAYFANDEMYRRYVGGDEFRLSVELNDPNGESYVFSWTRAQILADAMNSEQEGQDLVENISWGSKMDPATFSSMQIDRLYNIYS